MSANSPPAKTVNRRRAFLAAAVATSILALPAAAPAASQGPTARLKTFACDSFVLRTQGGSPIKPTCRIAGVLANAYPCADVHPAKPVRCAATRARARR